MAEPKRTWMCLKRFSKRVSYLLTFSDQEKKRR